MGSEGFGPRVVFTIPGTSIAVTETVTVTWFIMILIMIFVIVATRKLERVPKGLQIVTETLVSGIDKLTAQTMGEKNLAFSPYVGMLLIYLAMANLAGLVGLRPPTADVNTTMSLAIMTFLMTQFFGAKTKGIFGFLKGFFEPMPLLLPLNILGELANPISLSFRLFGNIVGGLIIMNLLYGALGGLTNFLLGVSVPIFQVGVPAFLHIYFDLFAGLLQSFIFAMLTMVFVSMAME